MSNSILSFASSSSFRNGLMAKNLAPYNVQGVYSPQVSNLTYETILGDSQVIDSPNNLIAQDPYAKVLYPLNEYGPEGGYNINILFNGPLLPVTPNQGPYAPTQSNVLVGNEVYLNKDRFSPYINNIFTPDGGYRNIFDVVTNSFTYRYASLYGTNFVASSYSPISILLSNDPSGSNGLLSQDSYIAKIGALRLNELFTDRINNEIIKNTVGRVNLQALQDPFEISLLLTGQQPLIYKNWKITVPENPIFSVADFATRLAGAYWPVSLIPGDYFEDNTLNGQTKQTSAALNVVNQLTGGFLGPILNKRKNPSEIFLANTGNGQRSALFANIDYNRYQPNYNKTFGGLLGIGQALVDLAINLINPSNGTLVGGYYVGSRNAEPSTITSPPNQVPVDSFGKQLQSPVYGPSELGILYEGNEGKLNFGLGGKNDSENTSGGLVWTSPKYKSNAGFNATPGGGSGKIDGEFSNISSTYTKDMSTNVDFKDGSILDQTQRLINSADNVSGINRLKHVGNAMNQVSKVFHDGYKEITKGSKVLSYSLNTTGEEKGVEYCRVFTKDTPYLTYNDLQKSDGITTTGRQFTNSVLDNTYNLNIAPLRGEGSTNIQKNAQDKLVAKKYMFSIENLAWRTSSRPGFRVEDLPVCEQGPNGGRVMWFPPYGLTFTDSSNANWTPTSFLGRPEPMYTYRDTKRSGTLTWKIIVDSPSVMNLIVEQQLKGKDKEKIDSVLDSFFAGCVKYDIYELAKKNPQIGLNDLYEYQKALSNPKLNKEQFDAIKNQIPSTGNVDKNKKVNEDGLVTSLTKNYIDYAYYFENDKVVATLDDYGVMYSTYTSQSNIENYQKTSEGIFTSSQSYCKSNPEYCGNQQKVRDFFDAVVKYNYEILSKDFITDLYNVLNEKKGVVKVTMIGSSSSLGDQEYNVNLSKRRLESVIKYMKSVTVGGNNLTKFFDDGTLIVELDAKGENIEIIVTPETGNLKGNSIDCSKKYNDDFGNLKSQADIYSVNAMACRRVVVKTITFTEKPAEAPVVTDKVATNTPNPKDYLGDVKGSISKKIIRQLLTECNYFDVIKETNPMVFDSIRDKVKYFNPAFHSMTPEGLNSRLTFLNQCVRPGETIPIIDSDNKLKHNDALNTSFGSAPVLILRIGDFYNTKIIPNNVSFTYDPLVFDMNPEGVGLQPMIANVTLSFDIIGGMGLAKPVEELQNALSFNYYGNTEIYDERATATEDVSKLDAKFLTEPSETKLKNENKLTNDGGNTIGTIITTIPVEGGQNGEMSYLSIMDKLLTITNEYYLNVPNQMESSVKAYNYGIWQLVTQDRNYTKGVLGDVSGDNKIPEVLIYGKPSETVQTKVDDCFTEFIRDVEAPYQSSENYIIKNLSKYKDLTESDVNNVILNFVKYIQDFKNDFSNGIFNITNTIVQQEQTMVNTFSKLNLITSKTDGKIIDNQNRIYNISETTETSPGGTDTDTYSELWSDYKKVGESLNTFNDLLVANKIITNRYGANGAGDFIQEEPSKLLTIQDKRMFMIMARVFEDKNKLKDFQDKVISGEVLKVKKLSFLKRKFSNICDDFSDIVKYELKSEEKIAANLRKIPQYKGLLEKAPYVKGKMRKFNYTTVPNEEKKAAQNKALTDLYSTKNSDENKTTFNGKVQFN